MNTKLLQTFKLVRNELDKNVDARLTSAIEVAKEWAKNNASVGGARNASFDAIAVANELSSPVKFLWPGQWGMLLLRHIWPIIRS